jgi:hypothetical protein
MTRKIIKITSHIDTQVDVKINLYDYIDEIKEYVEDNSHLFSSCIIDRAEIELEIDKILENLSLKLSDIENKEIREEIQYFFKFRTLNDISAFGELIKVINNNSK